MKINRKNDAAAAMVEKILTTFFRALIIKTILMDLGEGTDFIMSFNTTKADISR